MSRGPATAAFTLLEMLAVTAVLTIVVVSLVAVSIGASRSRGAAESRANQQTAAAAALSTIVRDLEQAVADEDLTFAIQPDRYGKADSELTCFTLADSGAGTNRAVRQVFYWVEPVTETSVTGRCQLVRGVRRVGNDLLADTDRPGSPDVGVVLLDVTAFRLGAGWSVGTVTPNYQSDLRDDLLPGFVDIYLETVDAGTSKRLRDLAAQPAARADLLERAAMSWATRVYLRNASGREKR